MADNDKVKTTKTPKNKVALNADQYKKPVKEWEESTRYPDGKEKIKIFRKYKNGVVKSSLKAMFKKGKRIG